MPLSTLYTIKSKSVSETISVLVILDKNHDLYKGHFPNKPITPGAVLLQILKELVEEQLNIKLMIREASNVKYLAVVDPNENPKLIYDYSIEMFENEFKIKNITTFPDGRLVLKCNAIFV